MSISRYDVGDLVRCSAAFTDSAGVAQDPAGVTFKQKDPSGNIATLTYGVDGALVRASTGNYYVDVSIDEAGTWAFRFAGTGNGQAAAESVFVVERSSFA